jgi:hypothetical protein
MPENTVRNADADKLSISPQEFMLLARTVTASVLRKHGVVPTAGMRMAMAEMADWSTLVWQGQIKRLRNHISAFRLTSADPWKIECRRLGEQAYTEKGNALRLQKELDVACVLIKELEARLKDKEEPAHVSGKVVCVNCRHSIGV